MSLPTVSVILPNYNHAKYLPQSLKAILDQSVKPREVIIIDDASTDNSVDIISKFIKQYSSIQLILNKKNVGCERSNLKGLEQATGDYVIFAGADDYFLPGFFEQSLRLLAKYPEAGICSALSRRINENGDYIDTVPEAPYLSNTPCYISPEKIRKFVLKKDSLAIMTQTALFNRQLIIEAKAYTLDSGRYQDGFAVTLMALSYGACFIPKEFGVFRVLPGAGSSQARRDPKSHLQDVAPMFKLMETTYADKFPPEIRRTIERCHLYTYGSMALNQLSKSQEDFLKDMNVSLSNSSLIDHLFFFATRWINTAQFVLTKGYLYWRLRHINFRILRRVMSRLRK